MVINKLLSERIKTHESSLVKDLIAICCTSFFGILLPLQTYGILPIAFVFLQMGMRVYVVLPILFSNILFNTLVPYYDASFVWKNGYPRILFAFLAGISMGIIIRFLADKKWAFQLNKMETKLDPSFHVRSYFKNVHHQLMFIGIFLISGVVLNVLFSHFILNVFLDAVFTSPEFSELSRTYPRLNVVNPFFLLALATFYTVINITNLSGLFALIKPKGVFIYVIFCAICTMTLCISLFF